MKMPLAGPGPPTPPATVSIFHGPPAAGLANAGTATCGSPAPSSSDVTRTARQDSAPPAFPRALLIIDRSSRQQRIQTAPPAQPGRNARGDASQGNDGHPGIPVDPDDCQLAGASLDLRELSDSTTR